MTWVRGPPSTFKLPISEETHDLAPHDSVRRVVHHSKIRPLMSALCQKRTLASSKPSCRSPSGDDLSAMRFKVDCGSQTFCGQDYHRGGAPSWRRRNCSRHADDRGAATER